MKIKIQRTAVTADVFNLINNRFDKIDLRFQDYLSDKLKNSNYGSSVEVIYFGINCVNPEMLNNTDFETGYVLDKKFTKSKKQIEIEVKLNHKSVIEASKERFAEIIEEAFLSTESTINELGISDFKSLDFYSDLRRFLSDKDWIEMPYEEKIFEYKNMRNIPVMLPVNFEKLKEETFWKLIDQSRVEENPNTFLQIERLTRILSGLSEKELIGFEYTLREMLVKLYNYNVLAVAYIAEGDLSDDSFLYFRCKVILHGKDIVYKSIHDPNSIEDRIKDTDFEELLLNVSDDAFKIKYGENNDKINPKELCSEIIDYDSNNIKMTGEKWEEDQLEIRYNKLWKLYN